MRQQDFLADFQFVSQKKPYLPYINLLSDLTSTMAIFSVTKQTIKTNALTAATQGISRKRVYDELGLMSLKERRWYNKLSFT